MSRKDLRKVEVIEEYKIKSLPGPGEYIAGSDEFYEQGYFHGWNSNGDLKGIVELEDGTIKLFPYENIKFLD